MVFAEIVNGSAINFFLQRLYDFYVSENSDSEDFDDYNHFNGVMMISAY